MWLYQFGPGLSTFQLRCANICKPIYIARRAFRESTVRGWALPASAPGYNSCTHSEGVFQNISLLAGQTNLNPKTGSLWPIHEGGY